MATVAEVDIANSCFRKIGTKRKIGSFDEDSPAARFAADRYEALRDDALRSHAWNFAMKRVKLAQNSTGPTFPSAGNYYAFPSDWIRTIGVYDNESGVGVMDYREENGNILALREEVWMVYVSQVTDPNKMTPDFREAVAYMMAVEAAIDLVGSRSLSETMEDRLEQKILQAKSTDAISSGPRFLPQGTWVTRRFSGINQTVSTT